jgi:hypothetical protein
MALPPGIKSRGGQPGVPTPYVSHVHPYPTRYHGGIWTRPVFEFPYVESPQAVFKPDDFYPAGYARYPWAKQGPAGLSGLLPTTPTGWVMGGIAVLAVALSINLMVAENPILLPGWSRER